MSFLEKLGAAVGVGAAEVAVGVDQEAYHWGDRATGMILVQGGQAEQKVTRITVTVMEHWEQYVSTGRRVRKEDFYRHYSETQAAGESTVAPGSAAEYRFEVPIPDGVDLTHNWFVHARVHVAGGADRHADTRFHLLPTPSIVGLWTALEEVAPFSIRTVGNAQRRATLDFKPPENLKGNLDGVKLVVTEEAGSVKGILEINPQEHTLAEHLKSLVRADLVRHEITFPAQRLAEAETGPAPQEVVAALRQLLQPYLG